VTAGRGEIDEGYVKYSSRWQPGPAPDAALVAELERWRRPLFDAGLIGYSTAHSVGYGNLSVRAANGFVISGTQTGHVATTTGEHYALVTNVDLEANTVDCTGPIQASSEAMTHAALYGLSADIGAVVHVHSAALWQRYRDRLPTTASAVAYGTPEMAAAFADLWHYGDFRERAVAVMAGHEDGLVSIGPTLAHAATRMLELASRRGA
jgi:ribulose-5-phosphate 4-epimerase/fuculose-1-phosphate aldolase